MKVYHKALVVAGLCVSLAFGVTACGSAPLDGSQTVATVGEKEMTLGEANFFLRYQQVQTEYYYESMLGQGIYDMDLYGDGSTYGESLKGNIMSQMQQYYILEDKAADYGVELSEEEKAGITATATAFLEANDADTQEQMTADQETVERILTLMTISSKTMAAIYEEADVTVTDEEAAQRGFSYIKVSKGSGEEALTEDQIQEYKDKLAKEAESINGGSTIDDAAAELELTVSSGNYSADYTGYYDEALIAALEALKEGEVSEVIETDDALYLAQVTTDFDEEATENRKASLISSGQTEYYNGLMETWKEEYPLTVEESVWKQVVFDRSYDLAE